MANLFYKEPTIASDLGIWGTKELRQNQATMGLITAKIYNDSGVLKLTTGVVGLNDGSMNGTFIFDSVSTLDFSGVTNGYWFTIELSRTNATPVFTCTRIESATSQGVSPVIDTYYNPLKGGYYITATKRLIALAWKTAGGLLEAVFNLMSNDDNNKAPYGKIDLYAGATIPPGWLLCNGASLLRAGTYANLFNLIGTTYGSVDGTHFTIPDFQGIFPRGAGTSTKLTNANAVAFAGVLGTYQNDKMQGHKHSSYNIDNFSLITPAGGAYAAVSLSATGLPITDGTNGTPRTGTETNPANLGINFIIKY